VLSVNLDALDCTEDINGILFKLHLFKTQFEIPLSRFQLASLRIQPLFGGRATGSPAKKLLSGDPACGERIKAAVSAG